jgi:hypothetical protein
MADSDSREQQVNKVIGEYLTAVERGQKPNSQELLQYPELAEELTAFFHDQENFDRFAAALKSPAGSSSEALSPAAAETIAPASQSHHQDIAVTETESPASAPTLVSIPGYEILGELDRGGMGVVYKARQVKLNRLVALKMILAGRHAGQSELARFRTEAEAIAALQHPHIVQVFEVGEHEGKPYFSLEFCAGGSLAQKLDGTPLPPKEAARLVETLARAMEAAHQKGIIHRDLKPANILLASVVSSPSSVANEPCPTSYGLRTTDCGLPKITDFGLAKKLDGLGRDPGHAQLHGPGAGRCSELRAYVRGDNPRRRCLRPRRDPLRAVNGPASLPRPFGHGYPLASPCRRPGVADAATIQDAEGSGDNLPEVLTERADEALRQLPGAGR